MADDNKNFDESFFRRMTRIFRSGPAIQRRVKGVNPKNFYGTKLLYQNLGYQRPAPMGFGREQSPFSNMGEAGILDRIARYAEFQSMEYTSEIATSLDIYADECVGGDDRGRSFHIVSDNTQVKAALEELFYDIINIEFNGRPWIRNLCKYGDFFLFNEVVPDFGVINVTPIPVNEIEREEGFDLEDPYAVRFKLLNQGNKYLENWQVTHLRIMSNDLFLPYGTSILEPARKIWRTLTMMEDAMVVYRIVRSPDRRVFYIDVGNMAPNDIPSYMEAAKATLRAHTNTDYETGRGDQRYSPLSIDEDYFIPVRGTEGGTKIETLQGGTNATATEDVEYFQRKLFAALKVPKAYLNYDEETGSKATLAQTDIRFSRTISAIQKIALAEFNKLAIIHLYAKGFDGADLVDFELKLSNPSTVALQQRLELWAKKIDIAGSAKDTELLDREFIQKNILECSNYDIARIEENRIKDKIREVELEAIEAKEKIGQEKKIVDEFSPSNYDMPGEDVERNPASEDGVPFSGVQSPLETAEDILARIGFDDEEDSIFLDREPEEGIYYTSKGPIKAKPFAQRHKHNRTRRVGQGGRDNLSMPDFNYMLSPSRNKSIKDLYDKNFLSNPFGESVSGELASMFKRMNNSPKFLEMKKDREKESSLILEGLSEVSEEQDLLFEVDEVKGFETPEFLKETLNVDEVEEIEAEEVKDDRLLMEAMHSE